MSIPTLLDIENILSVIDERCLGKCFRLAVCVIFTAAITTQLYAQEQSDTLRVRPDSVAVDTTLASPNLGPEGDVSAATTTPVPDENSLKNPVTFSAQDSMIIFVGQGEGDTGAMYGNVKVDYGETKLSAHNIEILFEIDELRARGLPVDTGMVGRPEFKQGSEETFLGDQMAFNLRSSQGRVTAAQTRYDDGNLKGGVVKMREDSTIFLKDGVYTTCNCVDDPSYSLRSSKMKVVDQKKIFTGPIQLFLFNIPTPLWLPFGFLPAQNSRRSGLLAPTYGEDEFGFYLRDLGWYFALNDYMDLQLRGGIWTNGSWQGSSMWRYNRRYRYSGQVFFDYSRLKNGQRGDTGFSIRNTSSFRWQHTHNLNPSTSLTSNVNLSTQGYLRAISEQYDDRVTQTVSSSVRFSKRWSNVGRSLSMNATQQQNLATNTTNMTIPNLTFSQSSRKPFAREDRPPGSDERWYEKVTYSYNFSMNNRYSFSPIQDDSILVSRNADGISWFDALFSQEKYERATGENEPFDFRGTHRIPINASFSAQRISLNITPNINYTEDWFIRTQRRELVPNEGDSTFSLQTISNPGFFALRQFSSGISANTTIYGLFPLKVGDIQGLRHTLRPTVSFTYRPDFSGSFWGYYRTVVDQNDQEVDYSIVSGVPRGLQQALSLSLSNIFEAKRVTVDSTGTEQSKVLKLLNLDASSSYNFAADSLNLSDISVNARTSLLENKLNISARASFSAYDLNSERNRVVDDYIFNLRKGRFARLTRLNITAGSSFRSSNGSGGRPLESTRATPGGLDGFGSPGFNPDAAIASSLGNPTGDYVDFNIPWSLSVDFTYSLSKPLDDTNRTMTLNGRFDFSLTPNWKIQGRTGYDFERKEVVTTNISFFRDFECWQMSVNWVPFGRFQSFGFNLQVKSGHLRDLLRIRQPRSDVQDRFGGLL